MEGYFIRISDVEKETGLSAKAIRLYEQKGLITVSRKENLYRDYDAYTVDRLKTVKSLRDIGISISDIRLYLNNFCSVNEILSKRKKEIEDAHQSFDEKFQIFSDYLKTKEKISNRNPHLTDKNVILGIDIGTTTLAFVVLDIDKNEILESFCVPNLSNSAKNDSVFKEQDTKIICDDILNLTKSLTDSFKNVKSIGITGQMHGVVCLDENGMAVSPLYTWQDIRADKDYCRKIEELTGEKIYSGYGHATLFYNAVNNLIPQNAVTYCTIMDYVAMRLTNLKKPIVHSSNASSLGLYDIKNNKFNISAIRKLNLKNLTPPQTTPNDIIIGYYNNIPISIAIGDNQASFFGSVRFEEQSVLVNYGTGSQISLMNDIPLKIDGIEIRPYVNNKYLLCYCSLCGGRAYDILENFFRLYISEYEKKAESQYKTLDKLAAKAYTASSKNRPKVSTEFCGQRENPDLKGSISFLDDTNFTPQNIVLGVIEGMVNELFEKYKNMNQSNRNFLIASGGAIRKGETLRKVLADTFGMTVKTAPKTEEAALGSALYSAVCGKILSYKSAKSFIKYETKE